MRTVVCIGVSVWDAVFRVAEMPRPDTKVGALGRTEVTGGIGANGARTVARLGGRAILGTRVGDDLMGKAVLAELAAEGIDLGSAHIVPGARTSMSAVIVDRSGDRTLVGDSDPAIFRGAEGVPFAAIATADAVLIDPYWSDGAEPSVFEAAKHGIPVVVDLDGALRPGRGDVLLDRASHIVFGRQGLSAFAGTNDPAEGLRRARRRTSAWLGVTSSREGVYWLDGAEVRRVPAFEIEAVDTLAAGDIWHAAFALGLAEGQGELGAMRFANAAAALKCTRAGGGAGVPTRPELEAFLRDRP